MAAIVIPISAAEAALVASGILESGAIAAGAASLGFSIGVAGSYAVTAAITGTATTASTTAAVTTAMTVAAETTVVAETIAATTTIAAAAGTATTSASVATAASSTATIMTAATSATAFAPAAPYLIPFIGVASAGYFLRSQLKKNTGKRDMIHEQHIAANQPSPDPIASWKWTPSTLSRKFNDRKSDTQDVDKVAQMYDLDRDDFGRFIHELKRIQQIPNEYPNCWDWLNEAARIMKKILSKK